MSGFGRFLAFALAVVLALGIGALVYNSGVSAGLAEAARQAAAGGDPGVVVPPAWGWGGGAYWHGPFGIGFFGIFFLIVGFFLVIGLVRAAIGWGSWNRPRGPGGWNDRSGRLEELHRELHRREGGTGTQPSAG